MTGKTSEDQLVPASSWTLFQVEWVCGGCRTAQKFNLQFYGKDMLPGVDHVIATQGLGKEWAGEGNVKTLPPTPWKENAHDHRGGGLWDQALFLQTDYQDSTGRKEYMDSHWQECQLILVPLVLLWQWVGGVIEYTESPGVCCRKLGSLVCWLSAWWNNFRRNLLTIFFIPSVCQAVDLPSSFGCLLAPVPPEAPAT